MTGQKDETLGLQTAVKETHDADALPPGSMNAKQLALLPLRNVGISETQENGKDTAARGPGRPVGSKNKRTEAWVSYILSRYPSPLEALAAIAFKNVGDLGKELLALAGAPEGSKLTYPQIVELLKIQLGAAKELAPYLHQKQPQAIDAGDGGLINLFIGDVKTAEVHTTEAESFDIEILDIEAEENQEVSAPKKKKSNAKKSNAKPKTKAGKAKPKKGPSDV